MPVHTNTFFAQSITQKDSTALELIQIAKEMLIKFPHEVRVVQGQICVFHSQSLYASMSLLLHWIALKSQNINLSSFL